LNNRRLWVLKRCREEGLLQTTKNQILVRVREPKSQSEKDRYTVQKCAVEAKIITEKRSIGKTILVEVVSRDTDLPTKTEEVDIDISDQTQDGGDINGDDSSFDEGSNDYDERNTTESNRFTALL
jgi:uncharacterized protein YozE (UPF0346 family)